jgi:hypothetical protein
VGVGQLLQPIAGRHAQIVDGSAGIYDARTYPTEERAWAQRPWDSGFLADLTDEFLQSEAVRAFDFHAKCWHRPSVWISRTSESERLENPDEEHNLDHVDQQQKNDAADGLRRGGRRAQPPVQC